ncbi:hypothetical protein ACP275_10G126600 [Erythranthe tilingii]
MSQIPPSLLGVGRRLPGVQESTSSPLNCEICGCHRNFHRKVEVAAAEAVTKKRHTSRNSTASANNKLMVKRKITSILDEFFTNKVLEETLQRVDQELESPEYHPRFVREGISVAIKKPPPHCHNQFSLLIEYLFDRDVVSAEDIGRGCILYATSLCGLFIGTSDIFGEIIGNLLLARVLNLKVFNKILAKVGDKSYKEALISAAMKIVKTGDETEALAQEFRVALSACSSSHSF